MAPGFRSDRVNPNPPVSISTPATAVRSPPGRCPASAGTACQWFGPVACRSGRLMAHGRGAGGPGCQAVKHAAEAFGYLRDGSPLRGIPLSRPVHGTDEQHPHHREVYIIANRTVSLGVLEERHP